MAQTPARKYIPNDHTENASQIRNDGLATCNNELEKASTAPSDITEYPKALQLVFIVVALILAMFLVALDMTIVATAIPRITDEFQSRPGRLVWLCFLPDSRRLPVDMGQGLQILSIEDVVHDPFCRIRTGSLLCGGTHNSTRLIVGRAIAGMGFPRKVGENAS